MLGVVHCSRTAPSVAPLPHSLPAQYLSAALTVPCVGLSCNPLTAAELMYDELGLSDDEGRRYICSLEGSRTSAAACGKVYHQNGGGRWVAHGRVGIPSGGLDAVAQLPSAGQGGPCMLPTSRDKGAPLTLLMCIDTPAGSTSHARSLGPSLRMGLRSAAATSRARAPSSGWAASSARRAWGARSRATKARSRVAVVETAAWRHGALSVSQDCLLRMSGVHACHWFCNDTSWSHQRTTSSRIVLSSVGQERGTRGRNTWHRLGGTGGTDCSTRTTRPQRQLEARAAGIGAEGSHAKGAQCRKGPQKEPQYVAASFGSKSSWCRPNSCCRATL